MAKQSEQSTEGNRFGRGAGLYLVWIALGLTLLTTVLAILLVHRQDRMIAENRFEQVALQARTTVLGRLSTYETALRGSVALLAASPGGVSRGAWREYVDNLQLEEFHRGIRGIGYVEVLRADQVAEHERLVRAEGFPDYQVQPQSASDMRAVVLYMEPLDSRNRRVLGYDLLTRPVSSAALEQARDTGLPVLSDRLSLISDTDSGISVGFHLFWPVYRPDVAIDSIEARRAAVLGFVFAPFRMDDLVQGIFGDSLEEAHLSVYQGTQALASNLLYGSHPPATGSFQTLTPVQFADKQWLLAFSSTPAFRVPGWRAAEVVALLILAQILGLLALLQIMSVRTRRREQEVATELAKQSNLREERFRLVIEASPNAIIVANEQGQMELVNRQVEKLFGYSRDELLGQQVEMLIPDAFRVAHPHLRKQFASSPSTRAMGAGRDLYARAKNGKDIPVEIGLSPVQTESGLLVLSSIIDISERKAIEARFREQAELIAAASRYKSEFLANMSHELRTPLNSIMILSEQLKANAKGNLNTKQIAHADIIHRSGRDLLALINDILDLSKIEAGRMTVLLEAIAVSDFAESVEHTFKPMAEAKGLDFRVDVDHDVLEKIYSDQQRIFQIIRNLFSNALKFTNTGSIRVRFCRPRGAHERSALGISVVDTGIGIPADKHQMIFEAFQQVDGSTSRRFGGTGLGLTISRQLADLLGGSIEMASEPGLGSTFTLYLPERSPGEHVVGPAQVEQVRPLPSPTAAAVSAPPAATYAAPLRGDQPAPTVLIIESDAELAQTIARAARDFGLTPLIVRNAAEALHVVETAPPAAIILDLRLPGANGWSLLRQLKANPNSRRQPIHVISGPDHPGILFDGMVGYLVKPVAISDLQRAFAELRMELQAPGNRILLVEDDPVECEHYARLIGEIGFEVTVSIDGRSALKCCREESYTGLVVDLNLPDMSGFELLDRLKQEGLIKRTGIIVNTGLDLNHEQLQKLREYSVSVLTKSADDEQRLIDAVRRHLNRVAQPAPRHTLAAVTELLQAGAPDQFAVAPEASSSPTEAMAGKRVLVVDDDVRNIYAMCSMLEELGLDTAITMNGEEALNFLEENRDIDLVLMDMMMPVMDGYTATRELKVKRHYDKPIIAVTARAMKGDREKCLEAGADDYLAKPVTNVELRDMLTRWLKHN
jgi:PAS domain S-box-containing protein